MGNKKVHTVDRCERTDEESTMVLDKADTPKAVEIRINSDGTLHVWNRSTREVVGKTFATLFNPFNQTSYSVQFEVVEGNCSPLLGRHAAEQMQLITVNYNCFRLLHQVTTTNILDEYADVFGGGLGTLPGNVHLHVEEGANPVQCPARRVPVTLKPNLKAELDIMV